MINEWGITPLIFIYGIYMSFLDFLFTEIIPIKSKKLKNGEPSSYKRNKIALHKTKNGVGCVGELFKKKR